MHIGVSVSPALPISDSAFTDDGLVLGQTSLIERRGGRYFVREPHDIERAALGARDSWFEDMDADEKLGQVKGCLAAIQILWRYEDLKNRGFAILNTLLNPLTVMSEDERVAALLCDFEFAAKLR